MHCSNFIKLRNIKLIVLFTSLALGLSACGGSGENGDTGEPAVPVNPQTKSYIPENKVDALQKPIDGDVWGPNGINTIKWEKESFNTDTLNIYATLDRLDSSRSEISTEIINNKRVYLIASNVKNSGSFQIPTNNFVSLGDRQKILLVDGKGNWDINNGYLRVSPDFKNISGFESGGAYDLAEPSFVDLDPDKFQQFAMISPKAGEYILGEPYDFSAFGNTRNYTYKWDKSRFQGNTISGLIISQHELDNVGVFSEKLIEKLLDENTKWLFQAPNTGEAKFEAFNGMGNNYMILLIDDLGFWTVTQGAALLNPAISEIVPGTPFLKEPTTEEIEETAQKLDLQISDYKPNVLTAPYNGNSAYPGYAASGQEAHPPGNLNYLSKCDLKIKWDKSKLIGDNVYLDFVTVSLDPVVKHVYSTPNTGSAVLYENCSPDTVSYSNTNFPHIVISDDYNYWSLLPNLAFFDSSTIFPEKSNYLYLDQDNKRDPNRIFAY